MRNKCVETADNLPEKQKHFILSYIRHAYDIKCCKDPNDQYVDVNLPDVLWSKFVNKDFVRAWLKDVSDGTIWVTEGENDTLNVRLQNEGERHRKNDDTATFTIDDLRTKQHC